VVDVVYIAACALDTRFTRICVASVRRLYPDIPIRLLPGGKLPKSLVRELRRYFGVEIAKIPEGNYGWGFVKLEPLFGTRGERFLVLDSDTVMTGPILQLAVGYDADFIVDNENQLDERAKEIYYNFEKVQEEGELIPKPAFLFNTGQWFGRSGALTRQDFNGLVEWEFPRRPKRPTIFKNGDQGVFNFVINEQYRAGKIRVARVPLMRWPGHGMHGLEAAAVFNGTAPPSIVHWAGMKKVRQRDMVGADLLAFFEKQYYRRLPAGGVRRLLKGCKDTLSQWQRSFLARVKLTFRYKMMTRSPKGA